MDLKIVLLSGWIGAGKDTVADLLVKHHGFQKFSFAKDLKDETAKEFGIPREWFDDQTMKRAPWLNYPAFAKDEWAKATMPMLFKHLSTIDGQQPTEQMTMHVDFRGRVCQESRSVDETGCVKYLIEKLFHTPRSLLILVGSSKRVVDPDWWVNKLYAKMPHTANCVISDFRYPSEFERLNELQPNRIVTVRIEGRVETTNTDASERALDDFDFRHRVDNREGTSKEELLERTEMALGLGSEHVTKRPREDVA